MMWGLFDPLYLMMLGPALVLSLIASLLTRGVFKKYSTVPAASGMTGAKAAERMMQSQGVFDVKVERTEGFLSDHYDPTKKVLRLSPDVYDSNSLSAIGVACHEAGHAIQHARAFAPLALRTVLVPLAQFGSMASYWIIMIGFVLMSLHSVSGALAMGIIKVGIVCFSATVVFALVTLPVEWDASHRAKAHMVSSSIVGPGQEVAAGRVLNAAFLTYVAAAVSAIMTLLYYLLQSGLLGGRRDD
ncbi:MAG: zinc metallopeptidase [Kiritimatiellia bacterium]